jgi:phage terminase large subunit
VLKIADYFNGRFHEKQAIAWFAYRAGLTIVLPCGRRSGKSEFFTEVLIEDVMQYGKPCLYLASTQESAREIMWPKLRHRLLGNTNWTLHDSTLEAVYKPSQTPIRFRGVEKVDNLAGKAYRVVVADEFALWKKDPPTIVKQILAPMIADFDGVLMYGSSKRGKNHLYDLHDKAKKNPDKYFVGDWTVFDNPFVSDSGRKKLLSEYDGEDDPLYRQEVLNEYVTFQGMVFAIPESDYVTKRWAPADLDHAYHIRGVDHGFSPDPTACLWLAYNDRKGYWLVYSEYRKSQLLIHQHAEVIQKQERYDISETISDIDPQLIAEYAAIGLQMEPAGKYDKQARLLRLVNALKMGRLKIADNCKELLKEMSNYEWEQDGKDHLIDSLIYAYTNASIPEKKIEEPFELTRTTEDKFDEQDFG